MAKSQKDGRLNRRARLSTDNLGTLLSAHCLPLPPLASPPPSCQPPRDSTTIGRKAMPCLWHDSPACPALVAARARYSGRLAGVDHSHVQRCILASHLVWKQRISCAAVLPRDEESDLPHRPKISCHCSVKEVVLQVVVAENALPA